MHTRYDWLAKLIGTKDLMAYYNALSPAERGSYMRLNRDIKEQHIRKIYEFCQKHGLVLGVSDPDFKELCTSGSCCAMPDSFPENPEMCNWSTAQLTYHVKNARIAYHKTGEEQLIKFNEDGICIGEIVNVSADESVLDEKGKIDAEKLDPIIYNGVSHAYWNFGEKVGQAFSAGLKLK